MFWEFSLRYLNGFSPRLKIRISVFFLYILHCFSRVSPWLQETRKSCMIPYFCIYINPHGLLHGAVLVLHSAVSLDCCDWICMHRNMSMSELNVTHQSMLLALLLTLVMDVLVLVHFAVHVWMRVCVYIRVDFRIDLGSQSIAALSQKELLMSDVILIWETIFIPIGRLMRQGWARSLTICCR